MKEGTKNDEEIVKTTRVAFDNVADRLAVRLCCSLGTVSIIF